MRKIALGLLALCFFLMPLAVWTGHFLPFETMKAFLFSVLVLLAALCAAVDATLGDRWALMRDRLTLAVAAYLAYSIGSFFLMPYTDPHALFLLLCCGALFLTVRLSCDRRGRDLLLIVLFVVSLLSALYALLQFAGIDYEPFIDYIYFGGRKTLGIRSFSFFGNPNLLSSFCAALIPLLVAFILDARREKQPSHMAVLGIILLLTITALILSQTRSAWLAAVATIVLFALIAAAVAAMKRFGEKGVRRRSCLWGGVMAIFLGLVWGGIALLSWGATQSASVLSIFHSQTIKIRQFHYKNTMTMIGENPRIFLLGRGPGTFNAHYPAFRDNRMAFRLGEANPEFRVEHAHNEHLEIISDTGLIGYLLFLWIVGEALWRLLRQNDWISLGVGVFILTLLIDGSMTQSLRYIVIGSLLWLMIGFSGIEINGTNVATKNDDPVKSRKSSFLSFP